MALTLTQNASFRQHKSACSTSRTPGAVLVSSKPIHGQGWQLRADIAEWQSMPICRMQCPSTVNSTQDVMLSEAPATQGMSATSSVSIETCDIRVGRIVTCEKHPEADSLYVEQIDVGEAEPRTVISGLAQLVPLEDMQGRSVIVICNLKPRNMRGVKSNGMVLCASNAAHDKVEPLSPPEGARPGERVWFGDELPGGPGRLLPAEPNRMHKKKIWESIQPDLKTNASKVACYKGQAMQTSTGPVTVPTLSESSIA